MSTVTESTPARSAQRARVRVDHDGGDRFTITARGHRVVTDQPSDVGGEDSAATPTELFVASLASCIAFYARRYLVRHDLDSAGLAVEATYALGARPSRVTDIEVTMTLPPDFPDARRDALLAVAGRCTVHNSITTPPTITLDLAGT
jgi:uncharacterized OsmC-like protein